MGREYDLENDEDLEEHSGKINAHTKAKNIPDESVK